MSVWECAQTDCNNWKQVVDGVTIRRGIHIMKK